jgi:hypothetical protein
MSELWEQLSISIWSYCTMFCRKYDCLVNTQTNSNVDPRNGPFFDRFSKSSAPYFSCPPNFCRPLLWIAAEISAPLATLAAWRRMLHNKCDPVTRFSYLKTATPCMVTDPLVIACLFAYRFLIFAEKVDCSMKSSNLVVTAWLRQTFGVFCVFLPLTKDFVYVFLVQCSKFNYCISRLIEES